METLFMDREIRWHSLMEILMLATVTHIMEVTQIPTSEMAIILSTPIIIPMLAVGTHLLDQTAMQTLAMEISLSTVMVISTMEVQIPSLILMETVFVGMAILSSMDADLYLLLLLLLSLIKSIFAPNRFKGLIN